MLDFRGLYQGLHRLAVEGLRVGGSKGYNRVLRELVEGIEGFYQGLMMFFRVFKDFIAWTVLVWFALFFGVNLDVPHASPPATPRFSLGVSPPIKNLEGRAAGTR